MPRATPDPTTHASDLAAENAAPGPSRRGLIARISATLLAGAAGATAARGAPGAAMPADGADAELIRLCDRMVALVAEEKALVDADERAHREGPNKPRYDALWAERGVIRDQIYDMDYPTTAAGAAAMTRAAMTEIDRDFEGNPAPCGLFEWLALGA